MLPGPLLAGGFAALAVAIAAIGYPLQRDYLRDRFATSTPATDLDSAYRWAAGLEDARIGLAGTTAGFLGYGFYGTDSQPGALPGREAPQGGFDAIPDCAGFRRAVNEAELDYLVTAPFLNFIDPEPTDPLTRGGLAARTSGRCARSAATAPVTVWRVRGKLDPAACGPANAPLRYVPTSRRNL